MGGTATVYEAHDIRAARTVAVKVLNSELAADPLRWTAFFEEVRAAGVIDHPGVVAILADGVDAGEPPTVWIVMEFVPGVTIREAVASGGALPLPTVLALADALLSVIEATHNRGVVHRDITPANVMFNPDVDVADIATSVRLLDFGVADIAGRTMAGSDVLLSSAAGPSAGVVVNVPYASPEQLRSRAVTERSDLYQVGATAFFALTGRPPGEAPETSKRLAHDQVDAAVREWLARALQQHPANRYRDATAMRVALWELMTSDAVPSAWPAHAIAARRPEPPGDVAPELTRVLAVESDELTRVFQATSVDPRPPRSDAQWSPSPPNQGRSTWAGWVTAAVVAAGVVGTIGISAAAQSLVVAETRPPMTATPTPESPAPTPSASVAESHPVPAVEGRTRAEAERLLQAAGFGVDVQVEDGISAADVAVRTDPNAGSWRVAGATVVLIIASGNNAVPDVAGLDAQAAVAVVRHAGFTIDDAFVSPGIVVGTWPAAGTSFLLGRTVTLTVNPPSLPPEPAPATPPPTTTPSPTPTPAPTLAPTPTGGP